LRQKQGLKLNFRTFHSEKIRCALFFSGNGSTVQALLDRIETENIVMGISSKRNAAGKIRMKRAGIPCETFQFPNDFDRVFSLLVEKNISLILLLGFMKIVPAEFLKNWRRMGRDVLNVHPSLLPDFKGLMAFERAFEAKADIGCSVHKVWPELDSGPILLRRRILDSSHAILSINQARTWLRASEQSLLQRAPLQKIMSLRKESTT